MQNPSKLIYFFEIYSLRLTNNLDVNSLSLHKSERYKGGQKQLKNFVNWDRTNMLLNKPIFIIHFLISRNTNHIIAHRSQNDILKIEKQIGNWSLLFWVFYSIWFSCLCKKKRKHNMCRGKTIWNLGFYQFIYHFLSIYQGIMWVLCVDGMMKDIPFKVDYIVKHVCTLEKRKDRLNKLFIVGWYVISFFRFPFTLFVYANDFGQM